MGLLGFPLGSVLGQPWALSSVPLIPKATGARFAQEGQCPRAAAAPELCSFPSMMLTRSKVLVQSNMTC